MLIQLFRYGSADAKLALLGLRAFDGEFVFSTTESEPIVAAYVFTDVVAAAFMEVSRAHAHDAGSGQISV